MTEIRYYTTATGKNIVDGWLDSLRDDRAAARIATRLTRLAAGNYGDCKPLQDGIWELRIDYGPGYRVYYAKVGADCVLLLCGGDKRRQPSDVKRAIEYWKDYKQRTRKP